MNLEESGKEFASTLIDTLQAAGLTTQLEDPAAAFESGAYFAAVQGYKRGVNEMVHDIPELLPDIFNKISESGFNMKKDWVNEFRKLILKELFEIDNT